MLKFKNYRDYLKHVLTKRMEANARYSQRAFARDLGLSPGELSEILNGKRPLSLKKAKRIGAKLGLTQMECQHFDTLVTGKPPEEDLINKTLIDGDKFSVVSNWYHFAIFTLADCIGFKWSYTWISKKLGIKIIQAKEAINNLAKVGMIQKGEDDDFHVVPDYYLTTDDIPSTAIREYHRQSLSKCIESLELVPVEKRENRTTNLAIDPAELPSIKKDIVAFHEMLVEKYHVKNATEVYTLSSGFIPLTKSPTDEENV